jgi:hypothetical protein
MRSLRAPAIRDLVLAGIAEWRTHIESYLTAGVAQAAFRADLDVPAARPRSWAP